MQVKVERDILVNSIRAYEVLMMDRGLPFREFSDNQLHNMSTVDLHHLSDSYRVLLRTPTGH